MADEIIDTMINELIATLRSGLQLLPEDQRMNVVARVHRAVVDELQYRVDANNPEAQSLPPETQQWLQWIEQKRQWKLRRGLHSATIGSNRTSLGRLAVAISRHPFFQPTAA